MPTACITQPGCRVRLVSERLEVLGRRPEGPGEEVLRQIPIRDLDRLIMSETVQLTSEALSALMRSQVPVSLLAWNGEFLGGFLPAQNSHGLARLRQFRRAGEPPFALQIAGRIVTAKLYNQRRVLQRIAAARASDRPSSEESSVALPRPDESAGRQGEVSAALRWLDGLFSPISQSKSVDELRGYEGAATARYFEAWSTLLPRDFPFERRSTRPPHNPVNACISFGATLLYHEAVGCIHAHGLDPALGLLHATENGRWSLALDLMEPFRPVLAEALTLDLFSHQMLKGDHFEPRNNGIYLNDEGRKKFLLQYERRMERQFFSEAAGHRTTLRQQLEHQAVMYKAALDDIQKFEPFLMN